MPIRKVRVDVYDSDGNKFTVTFEGKVTRDKVLQLLDLVELLGGVPITGSEEKKSMSDLTKFEKVRLLVEKKFPVGWFSSQDALSAYEDMFKMPIGSSTISTYLARLSARGILDRAGSSAQRKYRLKRRLSIPEVKP